MIKCQMQDGTIDMLMAIVKASEKLVVFQR